MNKELVIISILSLLLLLLAIVCSYTKKSETYSPCVDSIDRNYDGIRCLPSKDFQSRCVSNTIDNGTVYPQYAKSACAQGETPLLSVGL